MNHNCHSHQRSLFLPDRDRSLPLHWSWSYTKLLDNRQSTKHWLSWSSYSLTGSQGISRCRKKDLTTDAVVSAITWISSALQLYAGATITWSPHLPSTVPLPGYKLMLKGDCMPVGIY